MITESDPAGVQPSQGFAEKTKDFVTRLLPNSKGKPPELQPSNAHPGWDRRGKARPCAITPTLGDLTVLYGGLDRLLTVAEVAERLCVSTATVYKLCDRGGLPHVRIIDSIRVRPADLATFVAHPEQR